MDSSFFHDDPGVPPDTPLGRQHEYARKAAHAHETQHFWQMLWYELARDYNASIANVIALVRRLDAPEPPDHHMRD